MGHTTFVQTMPESSNTSPISRQCDEKTTVDNARYFYEDDHHQYHENYNSLEQALREYTSGKKKRFIIFANGSAFGDLRDSADLHSFFPPTFWRIVIDDLNGAFGIERHGEKSNLTYDTWSTFKLKNVYQRPGLNIIGYHWSQISIFTRQSKEEQFVLFIDCPITFVDRIVGGHIFGATSTYPRLAEAHHDPYIWHNILVEEMKHVYDKVVWDLRDFVREWETKRTDVPNFPLIHDIGRHLIHTNEALDVAANTIYSIIHHYKRFHSEFQTAYGIETMEKKKESFQKVYTTVQDKLFISEKDIQAIKARAVSLDERLRNEINLAYHVVTQNTAQVSLDMAKIARRDNETMKALALIGVIYLPGTFISGIFGSNFFNYSPSNSNNNSNTDWKMSDKFWIYWAITIPITAFTVLLLWVMLDGTMEMYESVISRVKAALRTTASLWDRLPLGKQPNNEISPSMRRYQPGRVNGATGLQV